MNPNAHIPVLLHEVMAALDPKPGEFFIDGTFGGGGHSQAILEKIGPVGRLLAVDWEEAAVLGNCKVVTDNPNVICEQGNYADLQAILARRKLPRADGLLVDLGFSSNQLESAGKGFSFSKDEPLIMAYSAEKVPAYKVLYRMSEQEIAAMLSDYGEERYARKIASAIKERNRTSMITTSRQLADTVAAAVPHSYERGRIHPATRTFQALRIYVNQELENITALLRSLDAIVKPGARVAVISFHSLEDRIVKNHFRDFAKAGKIEILTKKPVVAGIEEIKTNPRARSAKLRAAWIISD